MTITINNLKAIANARWIDVSVWLAEDPFSPAELWAAQVTTPRSADDRTLMLMSEAYGVCIWALVGLCLYLALRRLGMVKLLDAVAISGRRTAVLLVAVLAGTYLGGMWRASLAHWIGGDADVIVLQCSAIGTVLIIAAMPVVIVILRSSMAIKKSS